MTIPRPRRRLATLAALGAAILLPSCTGAADGPPPAAPTSSAGAAQPRPSTPAPAPTREPPPEEGECRGVSVAQLRTIINDEPSVPCGRPHTVVTFHVGRLPKAATRDAIAPADEQIEAAADRLCQARFRDHVGGSRADRRLSMLTATYFLPPSEQFNAGARWVRCDVYAYAAPRRLAELPRSLEDALERNRAADRFGRCSPVSPSSPRFRHVACQEPHRWRAVAIRTVGRPNERYPGLRTVQNRARDRCEAPVRTYLGTQEGFSYGFEVPQRDAWARDDRVALCWARTGG
jgi:hypothetical protein